jgi:N-methylhydantoinase B
VNGGLPGGRGTKVLVRSDGSEQLLPSKCDRIEVKEGDILYYNTWGGGGAGDPLTREISRVSADVKSGLVSLVGAQRYGVVINQAGDVDEAATEKLRKDMSEKRKKISLFDFGGTIEEIKSRCLEETGLQPPEQPVFAKR